MKKLSIGILILGAIALASCSKPAAQADATADVSYFNNAGRDDILAGGVHMIAIETPSGSKKVWTKRVGNNPTIKVLLLHGGPGSTHEYFEAFDSYFPGAGVEYYYYDQLGSYRSEQPDDPSLWTTARFVEEVEQVRIALGLDNNNFYLLGHSWGGILAMEYALAHQDRLKGLIISNMMASAPAYGEYAEDVLMKEIDPQALAEIKAIEAAKDYQNPRYEELLMEHHYVRHVLRMPPDDWPEPVVRSFRHLNYPLYLKMQGPSELGISGDLENWDRSSDIHKIAVPTLVTVARWDTMDPEHMNWMAREIPHARALDLPDGSHMSMYDDQARYFEGVIAFIKDVDQGSFDE